MQCDVIHFYPKRIVCVCVCVFARSNNESNRIDESYPNMREEGFCCGNGCHYEQRRGKRANSWLSRLREVPKIAISCQTCFLCSHPSSKGGPKVPTPIPSLLALLASIFVVACRKHSPRIFVVMCVSSLRRNFCKNGDLKVHGAVYV